MTTTYDPQWHARLYHMALVAQSDPSWQALLLEYEASHPEWIERWGR